VPPEQCPECGRSLRQEFVSALAAAAAPCPRCGTELTADRLGGQPAPELDPAERTAVPATAEDAGPPPPPVVAEVSGHAVVQADEDAPAVTSPTTSVRPPDLGADGGTSVRPPDLRPEAVRDLDDPVAGWDTGVPIGIAAVRDERPFPLDTVVVVVATVAGAALGAVLGRRPVRDAVLGGVGGAIGGGVVRRIWRLP
jgi:hypothetical protein